MTPFQRILLALGLGIAVGLFLGDYASPLGVVGDVYVGLLQMTVLPFIVCSIVGNIGHLTVAQSKRIAITGFTVLFVLWLVGFVAIFIFAHALPALSAGSFFSTSLIESQRGVDFVKIFVPSNPFRSLSENLVPAVVVFCIFIGFALMQTPNNKPLMDALDVLNDTLGRVSSYVTSLSPIGVFAISANAAGTITLEEFGRLQSYMFIFIPAILLLVFVVLPLLVAAVTPFGYRDILSTQGSVLVTALAIGSVFAVIPLLIDSQKALMARLPDRGVRADPDELEKSAELMIPMAYPFPHLGKIITLIFIPFAAWFYGRPMQTDEFATLFASGSFLSFGKVTVTIPFLLDLYEIPADIFRLFLISSVIAGPFSDLMGAAHLLAFTTLVTCSLNGFLKLQRLKVMAVAGLCFAVFVGAAAATRIGLARLTSENLSRENVIASMGLIESRVANKILPVSEPNPIPLRENETYAERVFRRGVVRVGFHPDNLPFSYYNARGNLVGHDIDMIHRIAKDFDLEIEFVPFTALTLTDQYKEDHFDIALSGLEINLRRRQGALFSLPYTTLHFAFVARDHDREQYETLESLGDGEGFTLGVKAGSYFAQFVRETLPKAKVVELWSESQFFEGPPEKMDALVTSSEGGSAWTLIHPTYAVVDPRDDDTSRLVAIMRRRDDRIENALDTWIRLRRNDGTLKRIYEYWILGIGATKKEARWSVIRNVLDWVE